MQNDLLLQAKAKGPDFIVQESNKASPEQAGIVLYQSLMNHDYSEVRGSSSRICRASLCPCQGSAFTGCIANSPAKGRRSARASSLELKRYAEPGAPANLASNGDRHGRVRGEEC